MDRRATMSSHPLSLHDICGLQETLTALSHVGLTATSEIHDGPPIFQMCNGLRGEEPATSPTPSSRAGGVQI